VTTNRPGCSVIVPIVVVGGQMGNGEEFVQNFACQMARRSKSHPSCGTSIDTTIIIQSPQEVAQITVVTISSRFPVVIPKDVRERLNLKPGQQVDATPFRGRVELGPANTT